MLKTNSKQFKENLRKYVLSNIGNEYLQEAGYAKGCKGVYQAFLKEYYNDYEKQRTQGNEHIAMKEYLQGLPGAYNLECRYFEAAHDLGHLLEQTEAEIQQYIDKDFSGPFTLLTGKVVEYILKNKNSEV